MNNSLQVLNQLYEIQHKIEQLGEVGGFERNFKRLFAIFEEEGLFIQDPTNEIYTSSRTDCEASIVGEASSKMKITKTVKPVIYQRTNGNVQLVQKAVVFVEKM